MKYKKFEIISIRTFSVIFAILVSLTSLGNTYHFENISATDGLSNRSISCILQDTKGFLWIGTTNGLNRFDGYSIRQYLFNTFDSLSLAGSIVYSIIEDRNERLIVSTDAGFFRFNPVDESFRKICIKGVDNFFAPNLCFDSRGNLWGLQSNLKNLLLIDTSTFAVRKTISFDSLAGGSDAGIHFALYHSMGRLWVAGSAGIRCYDPQNNSSRLISGKGHELLALFKGMNFDTARHEVLVADGMRGIYRIDMHTMNCTNIPLASFKLVKPDVQRINYAAYDGTGGLWVCAATGLFKVSSTSVIELVNTSTGSSSDFDCVETSCVLADADHNIWIGTMNEGLYAFQDKPTGFQHVSLNNNKQHGLAVSALSISGSMMYASTMGGMFTVNKTAGGILKNGHCLARVNAIAHSTNLRGEQVVFTNERVYELAKNGVLKEIAGVNPWLSHFGLVDSRGIVWTVGWGWGMMGFDPRTGQRYKIDLHPTDMKKNIITRFVEDKDGSFWLATFGRGLVHAINPASDKPQLVFYSHTAAVNSLSNNAVLCINIDQRGNLWLGTNGGGLNRFDKATGTFEVFNTKNGLRNNVIDAVATDAKGNVWFASTCLSKLDVNSGIVTHFDASDGVDSRYFTGAVLLDAEGVLYFGDDRGILSFDPKKIHHKKNIKEPTFTGLKLTNEPVMVRQQVGNIIPLPTSIDCIKKIELPYSLNNITLEFASLQLLDNKNVTYIYMLEGIDRQWIYTTAGQNSASYSSLAPGTYRFKVKAIRGSAISSHERTLVIVITPPWWATWWFRVLAGLVTFSGIVFIFIYRLKRVQRQNLLLECAVSTRTSELHQANNALSQQSELLQEQNAALQEQQLMMAAKNDQLNEVLETKDKLLGVVAHDFKNPLSAIAGLSSLLCDRSEQLKPKDVKKYSELIAIASDNLQMQMTTVLDWMRDRSDNLVVNPVEINIETIVNDALMLVRENVRQKNIRVTTQTDYETNCLADPRMMSVVFRNLLSNAIKFTPRGGTIHVMIQEFESILEVSFVDTGVGMSSDKLKQIFDINANSINTKGTENEHGTGFGLIICKSFVERNKGILTVKSVEGEGSNISVSIPKGETKAVFMIQALKTNIGKTVEKQVHEQCRHSILVIDDNAEILQLIESTLSTRFNVTKAQDSKEALFLALNIVPDLVVSDVVMPGIDGIELCKTLKQQPLTSHIPVLLITSQTDEKVQAAGYAAGATDFITKPFNPALLGQKIQSLIDMRLKMEHSLIDKIKTETPSSLPLDYNSKMINKVIAHIHANICDEHLDTTTIANHMSVSRSQLWRIFKNSTGKSLGDYIREIRMQKAMELLKTGKYRVSEIAELVGYSNPKYFSKTFIKEFGIIPSDFM